MSSVTSGSKTFKKDSMIIQVSWGWDKYYGHVVQAAIVNKSGKVLRGGFRNYHSEKSAKAAYKRCNTYHKAENLAYSTH